MKVSLSLLVLMSVLSSCGTIRYPLRGYDPKAQVIVERQTTLSAQDVTSRTLELFSQYHIPMQLMSTASDTRTTNILSDTMSLSTAYIIDGDSVCATEPTAYVRAQREKGYRTKIQPSYIIAQISVAVLPGPAGARIQVSLVGLRSYHLEFFINRGRYSHGYHRVEYKRKVVSLGTLENVIADRIAAGDTTAEICIYPGEMINTRNNYAVYEKAAMKRYTTGVWTFAGCFAAGGVALGIYNVISSTKK